MKMTTAIALEYKSTDKLSLDLYSEDTSLPNEDLSIIDSLSTALSKVIIEEEDDGQPKGAQEQFTPKDEPKSIFEETSINLKYSKKYEKQDVQNKLSYSDEEKAISTEDLSDEENENVCFPLEPVKNFDRKKDADNDTETDFITRGPVINVPIVSRFTPFENRRKNNLVESSNVRARVIPLNKMIQPINDTFYGGNFNPNVLSGFGSQAFVEFDENKLLNGSVSPNLNSDLFNCDDQNHSKEDSSDNFFNLLCDQSDQQNEESCQTSNCFNNSPQYEYPIYNDYREPTTNDSWNGSPDNGYILQNYNQPLTPPKSVSPILKSQEVSEDDVIDLVSIIDQNTLSEFVDVPGYHFEQVSIHQPLFCNESLCVTDKEELDTYVSPRFLLEEYERDMLGKCDPAVISELQRCIARMSAKTFCKKDYQGDSEFANSCSKYEGRDCKFYERIYCLQEKVKTILVCCDKPLKSNNICRICNNCDPNTFYTPLSFKNIEGDTPLSCSVKMAHSNVVVNYLLFGLLQCPEDVRRVFNNEGKAFFSKVVQTYPSLQKFVN